MSRCFCGYFTLFSHPGAQIQRALVRNNQTQRFSQRQALRLHQGLVTSTAEQVATIPYLCFFVCVICSCLPQYSLLCRPLVTPTHLPVSKVMERLCVRVQQQVCALRGVVEMEELHAAKQVLKEARNSRAVSRPEIKEKSAGCSPRWLCGSAGWAPGSDFLCGVCFYVCLVIFFLSTFLSQCKNVCLGWLETCVWPVIDGLHGCEIFRICKLGIWINLLHPKGCWIGNVESHNWQNVLNHHFNHFFRLKQTMQGNKVFYHGPQNEEFILF